MEQYARETAFPIIGPLVGSLLQQLVHLTGARRVFEMGSGYGYSAIWFALAMQPDGKVECTEADDNNIKRGIEYADRAGVGDKIIWHHGDALEVLQSAAGQYDIILNDVHKEQYPPRSRDRLAKAASRWRPRDRQHTLVRASYRREPSVGNYRRDFAL